MFSASAPQNLGTSFRQRSAAETLSAIQPLLTSYDIQGFADHTPHGIGSVRSIEILRGNARSGYLNLGKGFGLEAALTSGYMEAIEMATIEQPPEIAVLAAPRVAEHAPIYRVQHGVSSLAASAEAQCPDQLFVLGLDLLKERDCYALRDEQFVPERAVLGQVRVSTNGLASGNTLAEARLHAVYELIERHVGWLSLQTFENVRSLEPSAGGSRLAEALADIRGCGLRCELFHLGSLFEVDVVQCVVSSDGASPAGPQVNFGWGAHHSRAIAASRALCEAVQAYATRGACRSGSLPASRMRGGVMISADALGHLRRGSSPGEQALLDKLRRCASKRGTLRFAADDEPRAPTESLQQIIALMRRAEISALFSWTLSPEHRPFSVVRCVVPELKTFASD